MNQIGRGQRSAGGAIFALNRNVSPMPYLRLYQNAKEILCLNRDESFRG